MQISQQQTALFAFALVVKVVGFKQGQFLLQRANEAEYGFVIREMFL